MESGLQTRPDSKAMVFIKSIPNISQSVVHMMEYEMITVNAPT